MENKKYLEQFERIKRWHKELEKGYLGSKKNYLDDDIYYEDLLYTFFQNCFHLKDWLLSSKITTKQDINFFIESHEDMKICRDLCNSSKHLVLKNPSIDKNIKVEAKEIRLSMDLNTNESQISNTYIIRADGNIHHAFDVATKCLSLWKSFLENLKFHNKEKPREVFYDIVILLCASILNKNKHFDELSSDSSYLGGPIRMRAAVDIKSRVGKFIVVGGGIKKDNDQEKWRKVNDMRRYLINQGVNSNKIIRIVSEPDTHGNFRAIFTCLKKQNFKFLKRKKLGVLTNFYHLPRALRFAKDIFEKDEKENKIDGISFIPICAESVAKKIIPTYLKYDLEFLVRVSNEIRGLRDWEKDKYRDQNKPFKKWRGECYKDDKEFLKQ